MPFLDRAALAPAGFGGPADALAHDVITRLAKLRSLFVIAQGTVFALSERRVGPEEAGRMLNVDYVVSGSLRRQGERLTVAVELAETRTARIVWAEVFDQQGGRCLPRPRRDRQPDRRVDRQRDRDRSSATAPS